jgi:type II secretory pathway pseudopilin PulG
MKRPPSRSGYTLVEVVIAATLTGMALAAAAAMARTMDMQEELAWRVAVAANYQETASRLWQMGLDPLGIKEVMPTSLKGNPPLREALAAELVLTPLGEGAHPGLSAMDRATSQQAVGTYGHASSPGNIPNFSLFRPTVRGVRNSDFDP